MKFRDFIKGKLLTITLIIFSLATIEIFLMAYSFGNFIKIYIPLSIIFLGTIGILVEYFIKRNYYTNIKNTLEELDEKYLITEIIKEPIFIEGKIFKQNFKLNTKK